MSAIERNPIYAVGGDRDDPAGYPLGGRDSADYGPANDESADPTEALCKACGNVAANHTAGRFSIYGQCPGMP